MTVDDASNRHSDIVYPLCISLIPTGGDSAVVDAGATTPTTSVGRYYNFGLPTLHFHYSCSHSHVSFSATTEEEEEEEEDPKGTAPCVTDSPAPDDERYKGKKPNSRYKHPQLLSSHRRPTQRKLQQCPSRPIILIYSLRHPGTVRGPGRKQLPAFKNLFEDYSDDDDRSEGDHSEGNGNADDRSDHAVGCSGEGTHHPDKFVSSRDPDANFEEVDGNGSIHDLWTLGELHQSLLDRDSTLSRFQMHFLSLCIILVICFETRLLNSIGQSEYMACSYLMNVVYYYFYVSPVGSRQLLFATPNDTTKEAVLSIVLDESFALLPLLQLDPNAMQRFGVTVEEMNLIIDLLKGEVEDMEKEPENILGHVNWSSGVLAVMMKIFLAKLPQLPPKKKKGRPSAGAIPQLQPEIPASSEWKQSGLMGVMTGLLAIKEGQTPEGLGVVDIEAITVNSNLKQGYGRKMLGSVKAMYPNLVKILCVHPKNKDARKAYKNNNWSQVRDKKELVSYAAFRPLGPSKSMYILKCE